MQPSRSTYPSYLPLFIALGAIIAASLAGLVALATVTQTLQASARIVNVAGYQRTLSQRIALYALLLGNPESNLGMLLGDSNSDPLLVRAELERTLAEFESAHIWLGQQANTPELQQLYFTAPINLDTLTRAYIHATRLLLRQPDNSLTLSAIISSAEEGLLIYLDRGVLMFQQTTQDRYLYLAQLQTALILVLATLITGLVLFIFRPMLKRLVIEQQALNVENARREQVERDLIASTTLQRTIFDSAHVAIVSTDASGIIQSFNRAAQEWLGYRAEDVVGKATPELYHDPALIAERARDLSEELGETIEPGFGVFTAKARRGIPYAEEWVYIARDKARIPVWLTISAWRDPHGNLLGYVGVAQNITMIKLAEAALHESLDRYDEVVANSPGVVYRARLNNEGHIRFEYVSPRSLELNGLPGEALVRDASLFINQIHPDDRDEYLMLSRAAAQQTARFAWEGRAVVNGETRWRRLEAQPKKLADGSVVWDGIQVDTTAQRRAEEALWESQRFIENATAMLPDILFIYDVKEDHNTYNNRSIYSLLGYTDMQTTSALIFKDLIHPDDLPAYYNWRERFRAAHETDVLETDFRMKHQDGTWRWIHTRDRIYRRDAAGIPYQSIGIAQDVTERKTAEKQTLEMRMESERARIMADFIRDTSHDLKTPLTVQSTSLHLGLRYIDIALAKLTEQDIGSALDAVDKVKKHLERITDTQRQMSGIITEMLEMVRLDSTYQFQFRPTNLVTLVQEVMARLTSTVTERQLTLTAELPAEAVILALAMPEFGQAVAHLIRNALYYTPAGGTVTIRVQADDQNASLIIQDTGVGIPPEDFDRIFDRFYRVDHARNTDTGGSGLGLAVVKKLVELHQGSIQVTSELEQGSTFHVTLPRRISLPA